MAKKPEPPKPIIWNVYKIASKAVWLAAVEVLDEAAAIERGAAEFKVPATKLIGRYADEPAPYRPRKLGYSPLRSLTDANRTPCNRPTDCGDRLGRSPT
jgi:hypothetical protein